MLSQAQEASYDTDLVHCAGTVLHAQRPAKTYDDHCNEFQHITIDRLPEPALHPD